MDRERLKDKRGTVFIRGMRMEGVLVHNTVRKTREKLLMTKTEFARVEKGMSCRIETKRKIILALGYDLSDKVLIFKNRY